MELKLSFASGFKGFASIKNSFKIVDFKSFSVLSGVNGIGKTQFLNAIKKGIVDVEINGYKLNPNSDILLFNHETFKLENEQNLPHDFLDKKKTKLLNLFATQAPLNQFTPLHNSITQYFKEENILLAFTKLIRLHDQEGNFDSIELDVDINNSSVNQQINQLRQAGKQSNWAVNTRKQLNNLLQKPEFLHYFDPNIDLGDMTPDLLSRAIDKHQDDEILKAGFGEVFKKANDGRIRYITNTPNKSLSVDQLELDYQKSTRQFPWIFVNELFKGFRKGSFDFKYRFMPPTEQTHEALKPRLTNDQTGEELDFSVLSSGEKVLLALCLFLYQSKQGRLPKLLLLDEIDATLHPSMCKSMIDALQLRIVDSGTAIIFSSHTPFTIKEFLEDSDKGAFIMKRDNNGRHTIKNSKLPEELLFDRSPTYGEIMWKAFDMSTIEFHIDLYNALYENYRNNPGKSNISLKNFDEEFFIQENKIPQDYPWKSNENEVSIHTYLRNKIHHPCDNNGLPGDGELEKSIRVMTKLL